MRKRELPRTSKILLVVEVALVPRRRTLVKVVGKIASELVVVEKSPLEPDELMSVLQMTLPLASVRRS